MFIPLATILFEVNLFQVFVKEEAANGDGQSSSLKCFVGKLILQSS